MILARYRYSLICLASILASCGGESGGPAAVTPAPSPTPSASPTPTPAAVTFTAGVGGAISGGVVIFDANGDGTFYAQDITTSTDRNGQFGRDVSGTSSDRELPATAAYAMHGGGTDATTGYGYSAMRAPAGATTLSPATTLLRSLNDDVLAANTGLFSTARELATFAAVPAMSSTDGAIAAQGRRVTAFNLKLIPYAVFGYTVFGTDADGPITFNEGLGVVVERLAAGRTDLNDEATIREILDRTARAQTTSAEGRAAAAQLLARYAEAVDTYLTGADRAAAVQHGLRLIVLPELMGLFRTNVPNTSSARAITTDSLLAAFRDFSEIPVPSLADSADHLIAVPNIQSIPRAQINDTLILNNDCTGSAGDSPKCNDRLVARLSTGPLPASSIAISAVRTPSAYAAQLDVVLESDGRLIMRRLNGATGLVWFEYDVIAQNGLRATGRVYVRLGYE